MRLYTVGGPGRFNIDTVTVSNCTGTLLEGAFMIGLNPGSNPNSVTSLTVSDCNLTGPAILAMAENFGSITLNSVTFTPTQSGISWAEPQSNKISGFIRASPASANEPWIGSNLIFNNCTMLRNSSLEVAVVIIEDNSIIANLSFNGFVVQDAGSYSSVPALVDIGSQSIGQLVLAALDSSNIKAPVAAGGFSKIGSVAGAGVLATGWEFPDAVMANEVPYISATTGSPSIKINGVVEPYLQE
jgi:hypothetical protein